MGCEGGAKYIEYHRLQHSHKTVLMAVALQSHVTNDLC